MLGEICECEKCALDFLFYWKSVHPSNSKIKGRVHCFFRKSYIHKSYRIYIYAALDSLQVNTITPKFKAKIILSKNPLILSLELTPLDTFSLVLESVVFLVFCPKLLFKVTKSEVSKPRINSMFF